MNVATALNDFIAEHDLRESTFIVAVSGGQDSMCLLHACQANRLKIIAAHCNFMLRGDESIGDEHFIAEHCNTNKIRLEKIRFDTRHEAENRKLSTQETARLLRYEWFEKLRLQYQADYILTAHHGNDMVETFVINLLRGTGIKGLTGIPEHNGVILRPFLKTTREDIALYALDHSVPYRNDSSNESDAYTRNYIRHNVIPLFEQINEKAISHIQTTSVFLKETDELVRDLMPILSDKYTTLDNALFQIDIQALTHLSYKRTLLFYWLSGYGFNTSIIDDILSTHESGKIWRSQTHEAIYERGKLHVVIPGSSDIDELIYDTLPPTVQFGRDVYVIDRLVKKPEKFHPGTLYLDASSLSYPIKFRPWKQGDSFIPLGMKNNKKLSDFFIDLKLNAFQKKQAMLIESSNTILAVAPHRISETAKLTNKTVEIISLTHHRPAYEAGRDNIG